MTSPGRLGATSVASLLAGRTLLVTGSTGFLAKAFVAKVLRDLPDVERLVLLLRARRRSNGTVIGATQRMEQEVLGSSAFRQLRAELGDLFEATVHAKVVAVEGDLSLEGLGLTAEGERVVASVDLVVNSAATVVFDERLDVALGINTLGPRNLAALSRKLGDCPLLHVSTAYVCGRREGVVHEDPPAPLDRPLETEIREIEATCARLVAKSTSEEITAQLRSAERDPTPEALEDARKRWIKDALVEAGMARARERGWNDTYTYTKSLGERVLLSEKSGPACIVRPAIIESSVAEPEPGWIDGLRMADPVFAAYGKGALKRLPFDPKSTIDFIPVDHVVNVMIAAMARLVEAKPRQSADPVPIYQVGTSLANPLLFGRMVELTREYFLATPLKDRNGRPAIPSAHLVIDEAAFFAAVRRRQALVQVSLAALKRLPRGLGRQLRSELSRGRAQLDRIVHYVRIYGPYTRFPARFDNAHAEALRLSLSEEDRARFDFDAKAIDWPTYLQDVHLPGLVRNVLREGLPSPAPRTAATVEEPAGEATGRTVLDLLVESAEAHGRKAALSVHRGRTFTHAQVLSRALAGAAALRDAGVAPGDRVVLQSENRPEWVIAWFAVQAAGAIAVPLDVQLPGRRVREVARFVGARAVVVSQRAAETLAAGEGSIPLDARVVPIETLADGELDREAARAQGLPVLISPEQAASILFTSGTTLDPKGVVLPHRCFVANVEAIREVLVPGADDRVVSVLPLHHAFEFTAGLLAPLSAGGSVTYLEQINAQAIVEAMRETRATFLIGVPRLYELMLEGIKRQLAELPGGAGAAIGALRGTSRAFSAFGMTGASKALLSPLHARFGGSLRAFVSGGAALDPVVQQGFTELGFTLVEGYGLTECAPVVTCNPPGSPRAASVGRPLPGLDVRIHHAGADGTGEIVVRGPSVMAGYYKDAAATARAIRNGWFHTGDLGRFDEDGYVHVTGRLKDMIVTGSGKNVYPDEVEATLRDLPGAKELTVVGVRARSGSGEEVHLVVVPSGAMTTDVEAEASRAVVRSAVAERMDSLPTHQRVQRIHFWDELPKTALMKVKRGQVKARLEGEAPTEAAVGGDAPVDPLAREIMDLLARLTRTPPATLHPDQNLAFDLAVDSLMLAEMIAAIESRTGGRAPVEAAKDVVTVRDLLALATSLRPVAERRAGTVAARPVVSGGAGLLAKTAAPLVRTTWPLLYQQFLGLEVEGRENLPATGPFILAANHQSHLDAGAVLMAMGPGSDRLHVVAAQDYFFDTAFKGAFFTELLNAIPFDRNGDFSEGLAACRAALRSGKPLLIFPEGTRSVDGRLQPFKAGLGALALELSVPIVPTRIEGTHQALPKGARLPRRHPVRVAFGTPLDPQGVAPDDGALPYERYRAVVEAVRQRIVELGAPAAARTA